MTLNTLLRYTLALLLVVPMLVLSNNSITSAADLTNRRLELADATQSAITEHFISFDITSATDVGSIAFEYCSNSPLADDPCAAPSGFDVSSAVITFQSGETGFTPHANTTANRLVIARTAAAPTPGSVRYDLDLVQNPDSVSSQYLRIYTYATEDGTGIHTDRGGIAYSITETLNVSATVPPTLRFCAAVTIPGADCTSASGSNIDFGIFEETDTASGTTQMMIATNGFGGYSISVTGTTMTSGNNIISPMTTRTSSNTGTAQFGMNLVNNSSPDVGASVTGIGDGAPASDYSVVNQFKFAEGDVIATSPNSTHYNKFTNSYIVNIDPDQAPGVYATTLTFIAFATF